jgi:hypothetical protein
MLEEKVEALEKLNLKLIEKEFKKQEFKKDKYEKQSQKDME